MQGGDRERLLRTTEAVLIIIIIIIIITARARPVESKHGEVDSKKGTPIFLIEGSR